ncbi:unnamed protein product [Schistosoma intercalatum]|nr:unnamed protein product [Schistosoma intercalatum]CAH8616380.1 unnamed protein product [Schistosoma intercalatum]
MGQQYLVQFVSRFYNIVHPVLLTSSYPKYIVSIEVQNLYRTVLLGGGAYIISREALKAFHKRKVTHLKAIDIYKSQFPDRVPVKSYQTFGEIIEPWKPLR